MAKTETNTETNTDAAAAKAAEEQAKADAAAKKAGTFDYVAQIGRNFNFKLAKEMFGAGKAKAAMDAAAAAGGYGAWHLKDYTDESFGGFAIPQGDDHVETRAKINAALNGLK